MCEQMVSSEAHDSDTDHRKAQNTTLPMRRGTGGFSYDLYILPFFYGAARGTVP